MLVSCKQNFEATLLNMENPLVEENENGMYFLDTQSQPPCTDNAALFSLESWWKVDALENVFCERGHGCQYAKLMKN